MGNVLPVDEKVASYLAYYNLVDMLDFNRNIFNKSISLTPRQKISTEDSGSFEKESFDKYPLKKISLIALLNPSKSEIKEVPDETLVSFIEMASVSNNGFIETKVDKPLKDLRKGSYTYFKENDVIVAKITPCMENGKCALAKDLTNGLALGSSEFHVIRAKEETLSEFLFFYLNRDIIRKEAEKQMTGSSGHRRVPINFYENLQVPLPPKEVQAQIVGECKAIDAEAEHAGKEVENIQSEIAAIFDNPDFAFKKLNEVIARQAEQVDPNEKSGDVFYIGLENIESNTGKLVGNPFTQYSTIRSNKNVFQAGDLLYGKLRPNLNKVYLATEAGICSTDILVLKCIDDGLTKFYAYYLRSKTFNEEVLKTVSGQQLPRTKWSSIETIKVPVPDSKEKDKLVTEIERLEQKMKEEQAKIDNAADHKKAVMQKYL